MAGFQQWWRDNVAHTFLASKPAARLAWIYQQQRIDNLQEESNAWESSANHYKEKYNEIVRNENGKCS